MDGAGLFEISPGLRIRFDPLANGLPVLIIDGFYRHPQKVRNSALRLTFEPPSTPYPGSVALPSDPDHSLGALLHWALEAVNRHYLPRLRNHVRIDALTEAYTDFAIVDLHPDELAPLQRVPHTDPVPIFGLVYLNDQQRGGTLFFRRTGDGDVEEPSPGYLTQDRDGFALAGRIEPAFNRLAIYPGFVPHSGEIAGDWISSDERFTSPRLTQRLMFG